MPLPMIFDIPGVKNAWYTTFTPDGNTIYFVADNNGMEVIKYSHFEKGKWTSAVMTEFSGKYRIETPSISPDGAKFFFTYAERDKENIYVMVKTQTSESVNNFVLLTNIY